MQASRFDARRLHGSLRRTDRRKIKGRARYVGKSHSANYIVGPEVAARAVSIEKVEVEGPPADFAARLARGRP